MSVGTLLLVQLVPPLVVASTTELLALSPAAKQAVVVGHEIPVRSKMSVGTLLLVQLVPPLVVASTTESVALSPEAKQIVVVGHEMPVRSTMSLGTLWTVQVLAKADVAEETRRTPPKTVATSAMARSQTIRRRTLNDRPFAGRVDGPGLAARRLSRSSDHPRPLDLRI